MANMSSEEPLGSSCASRGQHAISPKPAVQRNEKWPGRERGSQFRGSHLAVPSEQPLPSLIGAPTSAIISKSRQPRKLRRVHSKFNLKSPPQKRVFAPTTKDISKEVLRRDGASSTRNLLSVGNTESVTLPLVTADATTCKQGSDSAISHLRSVNEADARYQKSRFAWRASFHIDLSLGLKLDMLAKTTSSVILQLYRKEPHNKLGVSKPEWVRLGMTTPVKIPGQAFRVAQSLKIIPLSNDEEYRVRVVETDGNARFKSVLGVAAMLASDFFCTGSAPAPKFLKFNLREPTVYGPPQPVIGSDSWLLVKSTPVFLETIQELVLEEEMAAKELEEVQQERQQQHPETVVPKLFICVSEAQAATGAEDKGGLTHPLCFAQLCVPRDKKPLRVPQDSPRDKKPCPEEVHSCPEEGDSDLSVPSGENKPRSWHRLFAKKSKAKNGKWRKGLTQCSMHVPSPRTSGIFRFLSKSPNSSPSSSPSLSPEPSPPPSPRNSVSNIDKLIEPL
eukprot:gb/GEZN01003401.1/.p1 GENE.gb/GEZN01003401.1/~~gb/GEZN01003401.1/.p1  ORF type:complete len:517 (-),score=51.96 gb/GEZN01003401.1/:636-2150(-)